MRFSVGVGPLTEALSWVSRAIPARPATPVLAGVHVSVADGVLTLDGFDYESSARVSIPVEVTSGPGVVLVLGRMLGDIVRALPKAGTVTCEVDGPKFRISCGRAAFNMPLMPTGDYPALPPVPPVFGLVDGQGFAQAVRQAVLAAGRDDSLPVLTGVLVTSDPEAGLLQFAATDRYRLAVSGVRFEPKDDQVRTLLVPAKTLEGYVKSLTSGVVELGAVDGTLGLSSGGRSGTTRLLDGEFPAFARLLPTSFSQDVTVNVAAFLAGVKRVGLVAERGQPLRVTFTQGQATLELVSDGAQAREVLDVNFTGAEYTFGVNFGFLAEALSVMGAPDCVFRLNTPTKPLLVVPSSPDGAPDSDSFQYLLMPVRMG
ncbi:DNA polymerase III subunit beta [Tessaracoccus sp.]